MPEKKDIYARLAEVEDRHVVVWGDSDEASHGHPPKAFQPERARKASCAVSADCSARGFLLPMLLQEEGREVKAYLDMHRATPPGRRVAARL